MNLSQLAYVIDIRHHTCTKFEGLAKYFIAVRNEVAKVMFLQVCVCLQGGGIPACLVGGIPACLAASLQGGWYPSVPCSRSPGGACSQGGCLLLGGACSRGEETPCPADSYCCGRYASYWNAFLLWVYLPKLLLFAKTQNLTVCSH